MSHAQDQQLKSAANKYQSVLMTMLTNLMVLLCIVDDSAYLDGVAVQHLLAETQGSNRQVAGGLQTNGIKPAPAHFLLCCGAGPKYACCIR